MHMSRGFNPRSARSTVRAILFACAVTALAAATSDLDGSGVPRAGAADRERPFGGEASRRARFGRESLRSMESDDLVAGAKRGDHVAGAELYRRNYRSLHSRMRGMLGNRDDADEATQQAFLSAFEAIPRLELGREPFEAWLFTIARHHAIDLLRVRHRSRTTELAAAREQIPPSERVVQASREDRANVQAIVADLSAAQQSALVLTYVYGCSTVETAAALGVHPATIRQLNSRALRKLSRSPRLRRLSGRA
jgi:RNA polymerase sigma-70 factor (ECF subfamily)